MPPVLHVPFHKLPGSAQQNLRAQAFGCSPGQRHGVLQLVAKTGGTTCLVETSLRPQAASHRLVQQPAVHQGIKQRVRG